MKQIMPPYVNGPQWMEVGEALAREGAGKWKGTSEQITPSRLCNHRRGCETNNLAAGCADKSRAQRRKGQGDVINNGCF